MKTTPKIVGDCWLPIHEDGLTLLHDMAREQKLRPTREILPLHFKWVKVKRVVCYRIDDT